MCLTSVNAHAHFQRAEFIPLRLCQPALPGYSCCQRLERFGKSCIDGIPNYPEHNSPMSHYCLV